jgi:HSP20 family protein
MARYVDPFAEIDRMFGELEGRNRLGAMMPMDIYERDGVFTLRFDLAGAEPDNVDVTVENSMLTVKAVRPEEDTEGVNWLVRERPTGTHSRQVRLGPDLDPGSIAANYEAGVLTVTIARRPEAQPQKISIKSGDREGIEG